MGVTGQGKDGEGVGGSEGERRAGKKGKAGKGRARGLTGNKGRK